MAYGLKDEYTGSRAAENTYKDLYRAQWDDYKERFLPYQEQLLDAATGTKMLDEQLGRISATAGNSAEVAQQKAAMQRARYGMQQTDAQKDYFQSQLNVGRGLSEVNAMNNARSAAYDRYQSSMTGGGVRPTETIGATGGASGG